MQQPRKHPLSPSPRVPRERDLSRCYDIGERAGEDDALRFMELCPDAYQPPLGLVAMGAAMELNVRFPEPREPKREEAYVRGYSAGWQAYYSTE